MRAAVLIYCGFNLLAFGMAFFPAVTVVLLIVLVLALPLLRRLWDRYGT